jgi:hypothetical protein
MLVPSLQQSSSPLMYIQLEYLEHRWWWLMSKVCKCYWEGGGKNKRVLSSDLHHRSTLANVTISPPEMLALLEFAYTVQLRLAERSPMQCSVLPWMNPRQQLLLV